MKQEAWAIGLVIGSTLLVGALLTFLVHAFNLQTHVSNVLQWIDSQGVWAPLLFVALDIIVVMVLFPGVLLTLGAGFLFGVVKGSAYVIVATSIGATLAFLTARYIFSTRAIARLDNYPRLKIVDRILSQEGWQIVLLTRLIPFFPFKLSNYLFGLTNFKLSDFIIGTFFGIWPFTIFNVYVGSIIADISLLGTATTRTDAQWFVYLGGFAIALVAVIYISHRARLALKSFTASTPAITGEPL